MDPTHPRYGAFQACTVEKIPAPELTALRDTAHTALVFTNRYVRALMQRKILELGSQRAYAERLGMARTPFQNCLHGRKPYVNVSPTVIHAMGLKRVFVYVPQDMPDAEIEARLALARRGKAADARETESEGPSGRLEAQIAQKGGPGHADGARAPHHRGPGRPRRVLYDAGAA